jgi:Leucine-rich repeat (LRR) protein
MKQIKFMLIRLFTALLMWQIFPACAEMSDLKGIGDPTRPPASLMPKRAASSSEPAASNAAASEAAASAASAAAEAAANSTALSAIRYDVSRSEGLALINEQWVQAGDKVNNMSVLSITQDAVLLSGPKGIRRLRLFAEPEDDVGKPTRTARRGRKEKK